MFMSITKKIGRTIGCLVLLSSSFLSFQSVEAIQERVKDSADQWNATAVYIEILDDITIVNQSTLNNKYNGSQRAYIANRDKITAAFVANFDPDSRPYVRSYLNSMQLGSAGIILDLIAGDIDGAEAGRVAMRAASVAFFNELQPILVANGLDKLASKIDTALTTFTESLITMVDNLYYANLSNLTDEYELAYDQVAVVLANSTYLGRLFGRSFIKITPPAEAE